MRLLKNAGRLLHKKFKFLSGGVDAVADIHFDCGAACDSIAGTHGKRAVWIAASKTHSAEAQNICVETCKRD